MVREAAAAAAAVMEVPMEAEPMEEERLLAMQVGPGDKKKCCCHSREIRLRLDGRDAAAKGGRREGG